MSSTKTLTQGQPGTSSGSLKIGTLPTGFEGNLTDAQANALAELRNQVKNSDYAGDFERDGGGDRFLLSFLRASMKDKNDSRVFQVDAAYSRLVNSFKWRREYGIDEIRHGIETGGKKPDGYELFAQLYPSLDCLNEEDGYVLRFQRFGRFIGTVDYNALTPRQWNQGFAYDGLLLQHTLRKLSEKLQREINTHIVVSDMRGLSMIAVASRLSFIKVMSAITSDHFPEMLGKTFLANCPFVFPAIFNVAKPFLDKDVVSKFIICSDVPLDQLTHYLPKRNFPKEYGGDGPCVLMQCLHDKEKDAAKDASSKTGV